ncbi:ankyrin repeat-containing domain protein [Aspergillus ambiguus]|uniref:ankyrin repeat-containing domain protein n=1 Tax=Aspergillus ambiguus TaxID=176160 RepID=UPI003CCDC8C1
MRLVHTTEPQSSLFQVSEFTDHEIPPYAILSHTWDREEVTLTDLASPVPHPETTSSKKGYTKVRHACGLARQAGYDWVWIDTCCIDKTSSAELSEAINSMYRWYQRAGICYAWLADIQAQSAEDIPTSRWFTRGWTLQERVAPSTVVFLDADWGVLGTKESLRGVVSERTGIPEGILSGAESLESMSVAQRMSWAARRQTSRVEDRAYSLLGIFGISIPLLYGEGDAAFYRLQEEIMRVSDDMSLFAWQSPSRRSGLLASSPDAFEGCADIVVMDNPLVTVNSPWTVSNKGIQLELPFLPVGRNGLGWAILSASRQGKENCFIAIYLRDIYLTMEQFERVWCDRIEVVNLHHFQRAQFPVRLIRVRQQRSAITRESERSRSTPETPNPGIEAELFYWDPAFSQDNLPGRFDAEDEEGLESLVEAAENIDIEKVRRLLTRHDIKLGEPDSDGRTLLWWSARSGNAPVVWLLLSRKDVRVNLRDKDNQTALSQAIAWGHTDIVWLLLNRSDTDPFPIDNSGLAPFHQAARNGNEAVLRIILARNESRNFASDTECGRAHIIQMLLTRVDMEPDIEDQSGCTPLGWAAARGRDDACRVLLDYGAYIDHRDHMKRTPLWYAVVNNHESVCVLLMERGAALDILDDQRRTPLFQAVLNGWHDQCCLLLTKGAKANIYDVEGSTPLVYAAAANRGRICQLLLEHGADINSRDREGRSPLWLVREEAEIEHKELGYAALRWAVEKDDEDSAIILRHYGANLMSRDLYGRTPLHAAAMQGKSRLVEILLDETNMDAKDYKGKTALRLAVDEGHESVVRLLLDKGADIHSRGMRSRTPLERALGSEPSMIAQLFKEQNEGRLHPAEGSSRSIHRGIISRLRLGDS